MNFPIFPKEASTTAAHVDHLYFGLIGLSVVVLIIVFGPMIVFLFRYRRGHRANRTALRISTWRIEVTWTVIPLLFTMGLFAWGARVYFDIEVPPPGTLEINVVGKQWMWKIQHQEGNREINELHIPIGRPVKLTPASEDAIHSFFVPALAASNRMSCRDVSHDGMVHADASWRLPHFLRAVLRHEPFDDDRNRPRDGGNGISGVVACRRDGQHARAIRSGIVPHIGLQRMSRRKLRHPRAAVGRALWLAGIADQWSGCHGGR